MHLLPATGDVISSNDCSRVASSYNEAEAVAVRQVSMWLQVRGDGSKQPCGPGDSAPGSGALALQRIQPGAPA